MVACCRDWRETLVQDSHDDEDDAGAEGPKVMRRDG